MSALILLPGHQAVLLCMVDHFQANMFVEFVEICLQEEGDPEFPYLEVSRGFSNITLIPFNQECIVREASFEWNYHVHCIDQITVSAHLVVSKVCT